MEGARSALIRIGLVSLFRFKPRLNGYLNFSFALPVQEIVGTAKMPDSKESKVNSIPSWQRKPTTERSDNASNPQEQPASSQEDASSALVNKATKFLKDEDIRKAPMERKRAFLQSKSLPMVDINRLLAYEKDAGREGDEVTDQELVKGTGVEITDNHGHPGVGTSGTAASDPGPPIITYPEFLLHSQKPPPLITAQRLLTTTYILSGAAAAVYGTSKYLVEPMLESLHAARHSLHQSASTNVIALNEKLEAVVSKSPSFMKEDSEKEGLDAGSEDSDAARFFTRTAATQTSPQRSRSASASSHGSPVVPSATLAQSSKISDLRTSLETIKPADTSNQPIKDSLSELRICLDQLQLSNSPDFMKYANTTADDPVAKIKAEIRGVKGLLLNARNFPPTSVR